MRISDWSSDVCSSDLRSGIVLRKQLFKLLGTAHSRHAQVDTGLGSDPRKRQRRYNGHSICCGLSERDAQIHRQLEASRQIRNRPPIKLTRQFGEGNPIEQARSEEHTSELPSLMRIP